MYAPDGPSASTAVRDLRAADLSHRDRRGVHGGGATAQLRSELQRAVETALLMLGQGFLAHPENVGLRAELASSRAAGEYFAELSRLVYRLIFLLSIEERALLHPPGSGARATQRYALEQSLSRLRPQALGVPPAPDADGLWEQLKQVFTGLTHGEPELGLPALGGIFGVRHCPHLQTAKLGDATLLGALREIAGWRTAEPARANWGSLAPEEIGSVYEALLGLAPELSSDAAEFRIVTKSRADNARRATGGYYTPDRLVQVLLDGALEPAITQALDRHQDQPELALRELRVVDPACGAGHFLLAAGRRLASHLARATAPGEVRDPEYQRAFALVVQSSIYGVDLNPLAVELCRLSLWLETAEAGLSFAVFESRVRIGNSLIGARAEQLAAGVPDAAWKPAAGDDRKIAATLRRRNHQARSESPSVLPPAAPKLVADAWCAAFLWPKQPGELEAAAPTEELWRKLGEPAKVPAITLSSIRELADEYHFFHWQLEFAEVFERGGFDVVIGNPPWIAHAGRAAQPLPPRLKHFFECNYEAFANYPTTHGMFVSVAAGILRPGGYLGLVIPSSLSELEGYAPTRRAHDRRCDFPGELVDFGESQFEGVTQPCMALVSQRALTGRSDQAAGAPWPMQRSDLDQSARALIAKLSRCPTLPPDLFGERGLQSDRQLAQHFSAASAPAGRFATPIREGTDVREFELRPPRLHVDALALGQRIRCPEEFRAVRAVVRQTARYPIAALSDGMAFRNSLLAVFEQPGLPAAALVALLNSALMRWFHYVRFRDARQPILPQVKIGHLRALPEPPRWSREACNTLAALGARLSERGGAMRRADREALDAHVYDLYQLEPKERALVSAWHEQLGPQRQSASE